MTPARPTSERFSRVFGLAIESNRPLYGLVWSSTPHPVDLRIQFGHWPNEVRARTTPALAASHVSPFADSAGVPLARGWDLRDGSRHVRANSGAEALIDREGRAVWVSDPKPGEDLDSWVLGPILSLVLRRRGVVCLHTSGVLAGGGVVAFAGWRGSGKSTMAALCAMRGCPVVADDLAALHVPDLPDPIHVQPGETVLRTRPGIVDAAARQLRRSAHLKPSHDGAYLDLDATHHPYAMAARPEPLRAIYFLDRRQTARPGSDFAEPMRGPEAVMALAGDTWAARWLSSAERAEEFKVLTHLVNGVPMWRVRRPTDVESWLACADQVLRS